MTKTATFTERQTRPGWATTAAIACAIALVGMLILGLGYLNVSVPTIGVGTLLVGLGAFAGLLAGVMYFLGRTD